MSSRYLDKEYTFDTNMLIAPIRKASQVRTAGVTIKTILDVSDLQLDIFDVTDDFNIAVSPEPYEAPMSHQDLAKATKNVSVILAEMGYTYDEILRINKSKLPFNQRVANLGIDIANKEDALAWAVTTTGVLDGDAIPFMQGGTAVAWDVNADADIRTSLATHIGSLMDTFGSLKGMPLVFAYNTKAFKTMAGLSSGVGTDLSSFNYIDEQVKLYGGPGSGIIHIPNLGCAVTVGADNNLIVTVAAAETVALMAMAPDNFEIYASPIDSRNDPLSKRKGLAVQTVERWFPYVHRATSILYDLTST